MSEQLGLTAQRGLTTLQLGNIFLEGEPVILGVSLPHTGVYRLQDTTGEAVLEGRVERNAGELRLELPPGERGHYLLRLECAGQTYETTLAVLTPFDLSRIPDSPFGVCTHYGQLWGADTDPGAESKESPESIPLVARAGFKTIRDELTWSRNEPVRGTCAFPNAHGHFMARCGEHSVKTLAILNYANRHYDGGHTPHTDEGVDGFAAYARRIVRRYGQQLRAVEVWNEFNGAFSNGPGAKRPEAYLKILKATYHAVKEEQPDLQVIGPAAVTLPYSWLERLFALGALEYLDGVSVHPYIFPRQPDTHQDSLDALLDKLQVLIRRYNDGQPKPLHLTEFGWPTQNNQGHFKDGVSVTRQARYAVRSSVLALAAGAEKLYWYTLNSSGPDPEKREHHFGLLHHPDDPKGAFTPKPAYVSLSVMLRELSAATFRGRDDTADGLFSFVFEREGQPLRVMWLADRNGQPAGTREITVNAAAPLEITTMMGKTFQAEPREGRTTLTLSAEPIYVLGQAELERSGCWAGLKGLFG